MANAFAAEKFALREACENRLPKFFVKWNDDFFKSGIFKLPSKWPQVIAQTAHIWSKPHYSNSAK